MIQMANYMLTLSQVFEGTATQATEFDFQNALVALTGLQNGHLTSPDREGAERR